MYPQRSVMTCGLATALEPPHFNHAPVRGATGALRLWNMARTCFNPRTRVGCDVLSVRCRICYEVSIHAPAWGATPRNEAAFPAAPCFNPRTRVGCDVGKDLHSVSCGRFQSTHPRGVRPSRPAHPPAGGGRFNPRTRVGCDAGSCTRSPSSQAFQSTHPRGVRQAYQYHNEQTF